MYKFNCATIVTLTDIAVKTTVPRQSEILFTQQKEGNSFYWCIFLIFVFVVFNVRQAHPVAITAEWIWCMKYRRFILIPRVSLNFMTIKQYGSRGKYFFNVLKQHFIFLHTSVFSRHWQYILHFGFKMVALILSVYYAVLQTLKSLEKLIFLMCNACQFIVPFLIRGCNPGQVSLI